MKINFRELRTQDLRALARETRDRKNRSRLLHAMVEEIIRLRSYA